MAVVVAWGGGVGDVLKPLRVPHLWVQGQFVTLSSTLCVSPFSLPLDMNKLSIVFRQGPGGFRRKEASESRLCTAVA